MSFFSCYGSSLKFREGPGTLAASEVQTKASGTGHEDIFDGVLRNLFVAPNDTSSLYDGHTAPRRTAGKALPEAHSLKGEGTGRNRRQPAPPVSIIQKDRLRKGDRSSEFQPVFKKVRDPPGGAAERSASAIAVYPIRQPNLSPRKSKGERVERMREMEKNGSRFRAFNPSILQINGKILIIASISNRNRCRFMTRQHVSRDRLLLSYLATCSVPLLQRSDSDSDAGSLPLSDCRLQVERAPLEAPRLSESSHGVRDVRLFRHSDDVWGLGSLEVDPSTLANPPGPQPPAIKPGSQGLQPSSAAWPRSGETPPPKSRKSRKGNVNLPVLVRLNPHTFEPLRYIVVMNPDPSFPPSPGLRDWVAIPSSPADSFVTVVTRLEPLSLANVSLLDGAVTSRVAYLPSPVFSDLAAYTVRAGTGFIPWRLRLRPEREGDAAPPCLDLDSDRGEGPEPVSDSDAGPGPSDSDHGRPGVGDTRSSRRRRRLASQPRGSVDRDPGSDPDSDRNRETAPAHLLTIAHFRANRSDFHLLLVLDALPPHRIVTRSHPFVFSDTGTRPVPNLLRQDPQRPGAAPASPPKSGIAKHERVSQLATGLAYVGGPGPGRRIAVGVGVDACHSVVLELPVEELDGLLLPPTL